MQLVKSIMVIFTACSQKHLRSMYDNKTPIYSLGSLVYEPSVDPLDNNFENSQNRPSYDEYRKR